MDSIKEVQIEIKKLTEAINSLAASHELNDRSINELANLSYQLTEKIHLLKFATSIFEQQNKSEEIEENISDQDPEIKDEPIPNIEQEVSKVALESFQSEDEEEMESSSEDSIEEANSEDSSTKEPKEEEEESPEKEESENPIEQTPKVEKKPIPLPDSSSLNDKISKLGKSDLGSNLQNQPIENLKRAIGLNERFLFANELFNGDGDEYRLAIEEFNHLSSMEDAMRLISHKYQQLYNWDFESEAVQTFLSYLQRRYNYRNSA